MKLITAGVDVQGDRLEMQVIGWGSGEEAWVIDYHVVEGFPEDDQTWRELDDLLLKRYPLQNSGRRLPISATCIDAGFMSAQVFAFSKRRRGRRVYATRGVDGPKLIWPKLATRAGKNAAEEVFSIGVDTAKELVYARLRVKEPGPSYVHFPATPAFDANYYAQLTSEQVIIKKVRGRVKRAWELPTGKRNEALDNFVYALAARLSVRVRLDDVPTPEPEPDLPPAPPEADDAPLSVPKNEKPVLTPPPPSTVRRPQSSWLGDRGSGWFRR